MIWRTVTGIHRNFIRNASVSAVKGAVKKEASHKPNVNIGTIGHVDHGKTTLTAAITKYLSSKSNSTKYVCYENIDKAEEERARGITINASHIDYETEKRHYSHTDCPGHKDFIKNMISGTSQMDGAVLVVAADDGCMPQTNEHLLVCKQMGVERIIPFINKADLADAEVLELIELEIRDMMDTFKFPDAMNCPVVMGSARNALEGDTGPFGEPALQKLLDHMDEYLKLPERDSTSPLIAPVDSLVSIKGRGSVIITTIERGSVVKNDKIDIVGFNEKISTTVADIQAFGSPVTKAVAGDHVGILCRGVKQSSVKRGMTLITPNSQVLSNNFKATVYLLSPGEGGRKKPISQKYIMPLFSKNWNVSCRVDVVNGEMLMPGDTGNVTLILSRRMMFTVGQNFTIRDNERVVITGIVTEVLDERPLLTTQLGMAKL